LDLAKLESRHFTLTIESVDLTELVTQSAEGFRREADEAGLRILVDSPRDAHVIAQADADRLQQVLANLFENALKFATSTVMVTVRDTAEGPLIEVSDDGPGIADEDLPHVFERLYVAKHTPQRREAGSGLGLAIVRELVDAMGGSVHATARPNGGTTFVVMLPR
ncbi:MAG: sensor histidine kinase, partial [Acidimicrobiales bacterium]|nr:sensor histidine kinase [Acidimicrobiales bacterium]